MGIKRRNFTLTNYLEKTSFKEQLYTTEQKQKNNNAIFWYYSLLFLVNRKKFQTRS